MGILRVLHWAFAIIGSALMFGAAGKSDYLVQSGAPSAITSGEIWMMVVGGAFIVLACGLYAVRAEATEIKREKTLMWRREKAEKRADRWTRVEDGIAPLGGNDG